MSDVGFTDLPKLILSSTEWQQANDEDEQAMAIAIAVISDYGLNNFVSKELSAKRHIGIYIGTCGSGRRN